MVRGSQVRFQSTKSTFSIYKTIYEAMPPLSDLPARFSFPLRASRVACAKLHPWASRRNDEEIPLPLSTVECRHTAVALLSTGLRYAYALISPVHWPEVRICPDFHGIESDRRNHEVDFVRHGTADRGHATPAW
jgi:hypothetical protein